MQITEVRVKLMDETCQYANERLHAFCSITLDNAFVIRDLKIIEGTKGFFVAMPSRKLMDRCPGCRCKNHLRARYCSSCGYRLDENRAPREPDGRAKLHEDIAHPINQESRELLQGAVIRAYEEEVERSKQPGYVPSYYDEFESEESYAHVIGRLDRPSNGRSGHLNNRAYRRPGPAGPRGNDGRDERRATVV